MFEAIAEHIFISCRAFTGRLLAEPVEFPREALIRVLPSLDDEAYVCLRFIDKNGLTIFNPKQMERFLPEWELIANKAASESEADLFAQVHELASLCKKSIHAQLWFDGKGEEWALALFLTPKTNCDSG